MSVHDFTKKIRLAVDKYPNYWPVWNISIVSYTFISIKIPMSEEEWFSGLLYKTFRKMVRNLQQNNRFCSDTSEYAVARENKQTLLSFSAVKVVSSNKN